MDKMGDRTPVPVVTQDQPEGPRQRPVQSEADRNPAYPSEGEVGTDVGGQGPHGWPWSAQSGWSLTCPDPLALRSEQGRRGRCLERPEGHSSGRRGHSPSNAHGYWMTPSEADGP